MSDAILRSNGFQLYEFDDGDCDFCHKQDPVIWFLSTNYWDCREGDYYCTECAVRLIEANHESSLEHERELEARGDD